MDGESFRAQVHRRRKDLRLSLRALSARTGISTSTISRLENGLYSPTFDNAQRIALALGLELKAHDSRFSPLIVPQRDAEPTVARGEAELIRHSEIAFTSIAVGQRRNLSKIAARGGYIEAILLKGRIQVRSNSGFRANISPGARIDCSQIVEQTYFGAATEGAELLWLK